MTDGDRDDAVGDAAPGPDLLDGGSDGCCLILPGDRVSCRGRTAPISVDLADEKADGEAGEGDILRGIESVEGGSGDDQLLGNDRGNAFIGRIGSDRLVGRGGDDTLVPGRGGGPIACSDGSDVVNQPGQRTSSMPTASRWMEGKSACTGSPLIPDTMGQTT
jgi:Ca2+-binding RTX toxin-like protein